MRALIRGLSSYEFEEAVLSAYDAMRGAGCAWRNWRAIPAPAGRRHRGNRRDAGAGAARAAGRLELPRSSEHLRARWWRARSASWRRPDRCEALAAIEEFSCNLNKCKRGTTAYEPAEASERRIDRGGAVRA